MIVTNPWSRAGHVVAGSLPRPMVFVLPFLAALATTVVNLFHTDPAARAETHFLALTLGLGVAVVAAMGEERVACNRAVWVALAVVAMVWLVYYGPRRGALVTSLLLVAMVAAAVDAAHRPIPWARDGLPEAMAWWVPAAFGLQILARGELLLMPLLEPRKIVSLVVLPLAAGLALVELARVHGRGRALLAGAAVAVLAPGWNLTTTLALVALAWGARLRPWNVDGSADEPSGSRPPGAPLAGVLGLLPLLLLPLWRPVEGTLIAAAAMALALDRRLPWLGPLVAAVLALGAPRLLASPKTLPLAPAEALMRGLGGMVLLPSAFLAPLSVRWRQRQGLVFLLAGVWAVQGAERPEAMAPGLVLLALSVPLRGALLGVQGLWSASLLCGTTLLASYPWGRATPRQDWLALLGIDDGAELVLPLVAVIGLGMLAEVVVSTLGKHRIPRPTALGVAVAAVVLVAALAARVRPATVLVDHYSALTLDGARPSWDRPLADEPVSRVVVDTHLVHGADLALGTEVARVVLRDDAGHELHRWPLRVGRDTAEWAAGRSDIASRPGFVAPPPWMTTVSPDGRFFAHRFRRRLELARAVHPAELVIERNAELPAAVTVVFYRVELRP